MNSIGNSIAHLLILLHLVSGELSETHHGHNKHHHDFNDSKWKPRIQGILKLISIYKHQHGAEALRAEYENSPDLFCSRKFVTGTSLGCGNFGNGNWRFFGGFEHAVVLNRTFIASTNICPTLVPLDWYMKIEEIETLLQSANCSIEQSLFFETNMRMFDTICFPDSIPDRIMTLGFAYRFYNNCSAYGPPLLGAEASRRARILFDHPVYWQSWLESSGFAFMNTVEFAASVKEHVGDLLKELFPGYKNLHFFEFPPDTITISIHMRHPGGDYNEERDDDWYTYTLNNTLQTRFPGKKCRLLLASDKSQSILKLTAEGTMMGCEVYTAPKNMSATNSEPDEQGPWKHGVLQMADLYFLAHSQHFIGYAGSTYAHSIGFLMAYIKAFVEPHDENPFVTFRDQEAYTCCFNSKRSCDYHDQEQYSLCKRMINLRTDKQ